MRTALFATTLIGLVGFYLYPLAPPRLLPQYGYVDTLAKYHTWGSLADPNVAEHTNQFAAMPSLHIGWALWCTVAVFYIAKPRWLRVLAIIYPIGTLMVIVGTANHFIIDAVGGLIVVAAGFGVQWLMSGHSAHEPAPDPEPASPELALESEPTLAGEASPDDALARSPAIGSGRPQP
jgi:hypothetical protein